MSDVEMVGVVMLAPSNYRGQPLNLGDTPDLPADIAARLVARGRAEYSAASATLRVPPKPRRAADRAETPPENRGPAAATAGDDLPPEIEAEAGDSPADAAEGDE